MFSMAGDGLFCSHFLGRPAGRSVEAIRSRWIRTQVNIKKKSHSPPTPNVGGAGMPWTPAEDEQLREIVKEAGTGNWIQYDGKISGRSVSSISKRWKVLQERDIAKEQESANGSMGKRRVTIAQEVKSFAIFCFLAGGADATIRIASRAKSECEQKKVVTQVVQQAYRPHPPGYRQRGCVLTL